MKRYDISVGYSHGPQLDIERSIDGEWVRFEEMQAADEPSVTGYQAAFYQIAELLGLSAMPISPKDAFKLCILPRLRELIAAVEHKPHIIGPAGFKCPCEACLRELSKGENHGS